MHKLVPLITLLIIILGGLTMLPRVSIAVTLESQYSDIRSQGIIFANICSSEKAACACRDQGDCSLEDLLQVVVNIGTFILAISGSIFLLIMVYGGMTWLLSRGDPSKVERGKGAMNAALIGLAIILGAYTAITLVISVLKTGEIPEGDETLEEVLNEEDLIETTTE